MQMVSGALGSLARGLQVCSGSSHVLETRYCTPVADTPAPALVLSPAPYPKTLLSRTLRGRRPVTRVNEVRPAKGALKHNVVKAVRSRFQLSEEDGGITLTSRHSGGPGP